jgi:hypothetical protein
MLTGPTATSRPAFLPLSAAFVEHAHLQCRLFRLLGPRLVDLLDHLKRQDEIADLARLAIPDQLHLALVLEQKKTKFVRQGLVSFEIADDLLFFLFGQRHMFTSPGLREVYCRDS